MFGKLVSRLSQIFFSRQTQIFDAAVIIAISLIVAKILGLIRYRLLAAYFGSQIAILDSFIAASLVPDVIFEVLIFGSLSLAFIPVFSTYLAKNNQQAAWELVKVLINWALLLFLIIGFGIFIFAPHVTLLVAPGLAADPALVKLITQLIRLMIASQLFFLVAIFFTGILQSYSHFLIPAIAPLFYNLGIIFGIVFLSPAVGIFGPAVGMILGAAGFAAIQVPAVIRLGPIFALKFNFKHAGVIRVAQLAWPRVLGLAAVRIVDWTNIALASLFASGSIVAFNFAQTLQLVPVALFGASIAQAALPTLSTQVAKLQLPHFRQTFISSLHQILFFILPATSSLAVLRIPAVRLVFGARNFPWETTVLTSQILILLAISLAAQAALLLVVRAFYALGDAKTPVVWGLTTAVLNIALAVGFILFLKLGLVYLAVAYSISNLFYAGILIFFLDRKIGGFDKKQLLIPPVKMLVAAVLMAIFLYLPFKILDAALDTSRTINLLILTIVSTAVGLVIYFGFAQLLKIGQARLLTTLFSRIKNLAKSSSAGVLER